MAAAVRPEKILRELDELWAGMGKESEGAGVLRACAMTLIVITDDTDTGDAGETLAKLMREHPARAVVLKLAPGEGERLEGRVFAQCWMPFGRRQQICCEQIEITSSAASMKEVPPVVRALTAPDLPVIVWSRVPGLLRRAEMAPLLELASKVIVNSAGVTDAAGRLRGILEESRRRVVADLAWTRLTRWREMVAQVFDEPACAGQIPLLDEAWIEYDGSFVPTSVYYMMGWLGSALGRDLRFGIRQAGDCERPRLHGVTLRGGALDLRIEVEQSRAAEVAVCGREAHPVMPSLSEYELLREELSIVGRDPVFEAALERAERYARERAG